MRTGELYTDDVDERPLRARFGPSGDGPADPDAAPLRDGPLWERVLRIAGAVAVVLYLALYAYDGLRAPRVVSSRDARGSAYEQLLRDANAGRGARIDVRDNSVRWQNRDGAVYEVRHGGLDFRAMVERQPYVQQHPGAVTYGRIDRRVHGELGETPGVWLVILILIATLGRRAYPRAATRWGWVWPVWSFVGVPLYLLLSGSWVRTRPPPASDVEAPRRVDGVASILAVVVATQLVGGVGGRLYESRHPIRTRGEFVEHDPFEDLR
jgi:hypothetical protein